MEVRKYLDLNDNKNTWYQNMWDALQLYSEGNIDP